MPLGKSHPIGFDELIDLHEPHLRRTWSERRSDEDILVLGDLRSQEFARITREQLGPEMVDEFLAFAERTGGSSWLARGHSPDFVGNLRKSGGFESRSLAGNLECVLRARNGLVPLLVLSVNRAFATAWAPPGCNVVVERVATPVAAETN
jgi:hypothetical protein